MTAHVMKEDRDKCLAAGMDDFLSKPVRVAHLEAVLTHWLTAPPPVDVGKTPPSSDLTDEPPVRTHAERNCSTKTLSSPSVDWEIFEELSGNNPQRLHELSERYLQQTTNQLTKLREAIATGSVPDLKRVAHGIAGSSAMCGMNPMVALMRELEQMGRTGRLADAPRVFTEASDEFTRIEQFFRCQIETAVNLRA
jgi:HPt (histidine-containing phosphotransfer) domain-containing protein